LASILRRRNNRIRRHGELWRSVHSEMFELRR
jgi:hypothetical protein